MIVVVVVVWLDFFVCLFRARPAFLVVSFIAMCKKRLSSVLSSGQDNCLLYMMPSCPSLGGHCFSLQMSSDYCVYSTVALEWKAILCCSVVNSKFLDSLVPMLHTLTAMLWSANEPSFHFQIRMQTTTLSYYKLCCYNNDNFVPFLLPTSWQFGFLLQRIPSLLHGRCLCMDYFYFLVTYLCVFWVTDSLSWSRSDLSRLVTTY